jgi:hypothetical protein
MTQVITAIQALQGSGGRTTIFSGLELQGETISGVGKPQSDSDAISAGHAASQFSPEVVGPQLDVGGSNALKGLTYLMLKSNAAASYFPVSAKAAVFASANQVVFCNTTTAGFTVTLPPSTASAGATIVVEKISADGNTLTIAASGTDKINGAATKTTTVQYTRFTLISDGAGNWYF